MSPWRHRLWNGYWKTRNAIHRTYARFLRCPWKGHRWATSWDSSWPAGYSETTCLHCGRYHPERGQVQECLYPEEPPKPRPECPPNGLLFDLEAFRSAWRKA